MKSKRDNHSNDDGPHPDKRNRRNDDQVRVLIPSNVCNIFISLVIIKNMQQKIII